jgi:lipoprotein Spr|tara:strand:+ start:1424 stop:2179 length:756 start_codon:yes stop_codon:yes gene_type:complete
MTYNKSLVYVLGLCTVFLLNSCASSKKALIVNQENEISALESQVREINRAQTILNEENGELKDQILTLNLTIEGFDSSSNTSVSSSSSSKDKSQLSQIEIRFASTAAFISFKRGGLEKNISINKSSINSVIESAKTFMGAPHVMGGLSKTGIDCSGLIYQAFKLNDITTIPRIAQEQARYGTIISDMRDLRKGDLVFFTKTYSTSKFITHVGIYLGQYEFLHTSSSRGVSIASITSNYWKGKFAYGTRLTN